MDLTQLKDRPVEWLKGGPEGDVVISSRVRLARNIDGYPFVPRASDRQKARIEELLRNVITSLPAEPPLSYVRLDQEPRLQRELLVERRLISSELAEADWVRAMAFDQSEQTSIMVNEEDHLRVQFIRGGLRLEEVYGAVDRLDDLLSRRVPFAYSSKYGFLTACPTNVGTGMRASVMLHLPGIVMSQEMDNVLNATSSRKLSLRGVYGEGTYGAGDFYQVSNHATLGPSEQEIVESVTVAATELVELERTARLNLYNRHREELQARLQRAAHLLRSASTISSQEALSLLSQIRMGVEMELLSETSMETLNELLLLTLPAHLQTMEGRVLDSSVRNELRASYVRERLATG
ncbi:MAG: ATP--guanido phosphotransferase [Planctomycetota bacterium]|jgi:protein arginine kinase